MTTVDDLFELLQRRGGTSYFGEPVTQLEHALQCAHLAEVGGAPPALIVAALLHDLGHLLHGMPENAAASGIDTAHQELGSDWLAPHFGADVTRPIVLHVAAKRYLCTVDSNYARQLSPASLQSLHLQGGVMDEEERKQFESVDYFQQALQLRRWDDLTKIENFHVPNCEHYRSFVEAVVYKSFRFSP